MSVLVVALVVALVGACSDDDPGTAAAVDGVAIRAGEVDAVVEVLSADQATADSFRQELAQIYRAATRVYPDSIEATALSVRIIDELVAGELAERDVSPTDFDRRGAEQLLRDTYGQQAEALPVEFRDRWVTAMANRIALSNLLAVERPPEEVTEADIEAAYRRAAAAAAGGPDVACVTVVFLAFSDTPGQSTSPTPEQEAATLAEAEAAYDRVRGGEDIVRVALDVSDDGSKDLGGDIGCVEVRDDPATPFEEAIASARVGEVGPPIPDPSGYYLIKVRSRGVVPLEELRRDLVATLERQRAQQFPGDLAPWLVDLAGEATIEVDPAWGTWDAENATVVPPGAVGG
jgi:hypothetical protein